MKRFLPLVALLTLATGLVSLRKSFADEKTSTHNLKAAAETFSKISEAKYEEILEWKVGDAPVFYVEENSTLSGSFQTFFKFTPCLSASAKIGPNEAIEDLVVRLAEIKTPVTQRGAVVMEALGINTNGTAMVFMRTDRQLRYVAFKSSDGWDFLQIYNAQSLKLTKGTLNIGQPSPWQPRGQGYRTPRPDPGSTTAEGTARMNRAMAAARAKLDLVISTLRMSGDFIIKDHAYIRDGRVTVNLDIDLVSQDAKSAFASRKLQNNTYPGFKRIYEDAMREKGFSSVSVYINTNPFKH